MNKPLISYINDYVGVNYSNLFDFIRDLKYSTPEKNVSSLVSVLLFIDSMERDEKND